MKTTFFIDALNEIGYEKLNEILDTKVAEDTIPSDITYKVKGIDHRTGHLLVEATYKKEKY